MVPLMSIQVVTGASGYLGSWVTKELLAADHTVRGTVRNLSDSGKLAHLHALQQEFPGKLELVQADLTSPGSFDAALTGAQVFHHTASPYTPGKLKDPQAQLIGPAVEGTKEVLAAVNRTASIERVVLTSSIVAIAGSMRNSVEKYGGKVYRESWKGFIGQKNSVANKCKFPWLLNLDADEVVSPALRDEFHKLFQDDSRLKSFGAFQFPRCTEYCGRWIRHGDWYPDRVLRLWKKDLAKWVGDEPHARLDVRGTPESAG